MQSHLTDFTWSQLKQLSNNTPTTNIPDLLGQSTESQQNVQLMLLILTRQDQQTYN